ncbi:hypothetical protein [Rhodopirellula sp. MGV]|uniref:hypothetical protein n=1 Tax=Rhodopirellula sp. MGV TaxID=2023130 RepID=UPI000B976008|nr:hypothetical protein [Rhodopirellula sp. MGV]OYP31039.1 hypothetical protein CGZ80_21960 [Rhodopirellula sp. MGV]PNY34614.1 hypothetical protein C2E31_21745 [Rhodopirellula baltica]
MKNKILGVAIALVLASPLAAADEKPNKKKGQRNQVSVQMMKQLEKAELTEEQQAKLKELAKKANAEMQTLRKEAGLTPELMKKRAEAQKEIKESGEVKKPAELFAEANKQAGLNEKQAAALKKANDVRAELLKKAVAMLSDEQKSKLPKQLLRRGSEGGNRADGAKKGKAKKDAA